VKVVVSAGARADLERLVAFLVVLNPTASRNARESIADAMRSLQEFPDRGKPAGNGRDLFKRFGRAAYVIRYRVDHDTDEVIVLRIWHSREQRA
jgi:plasmid stabilization system protein ParE